MRLLKIKQALCLFLALNISLVCTPAQADIATAFQNLVTSGATVSTTTPGLYTSEARNSFVGGGLEVRFPTEMAPQLINVTPFRFQAGCGGISFAFGGFSFISGAEIEQLIRSVAQNSIGMAVELVMTTLCGPCASVMQVMRNLALLASKNSLDSCRIAQQLTGTTGLQPMLGAAPGAGAGQTNMCGLLNSTFGNSNDFTDAMNSTCTDASSAVSSLTGLANSAITGLGGILGSQSSQMTLCGIGATCNTIWTLLGTGPLGNGGGSTALSADQIRSRLLIMNVLGTNITVGKAATSTATASTSSTSAQTTAAATASLNSSGTATATTTTALGATSTTTAGSGTLVSPAQTTSGPPTQTYAPMLGNVHGSSTGGDMEQVFQLYMCGINPTVNNGSISQAAQDAIAWYCNPPAAAGVTFQNISTTPVWDCIPQGGGTADYTSCLTMSQEPLSGSPLAQTEGYLPLVATLLDQGVTAIRNNQPLSANLIGLIQSVPVPIYQALNASAVYPDAGADLLSVMSVEIAELITYQDLRGLIRAASTYQQNMNIPATEIDRIYTLLSGMRAGTNNRQAQMQTQMALQNGLMEQIRQLNIAMQRDVMPPELLAAHDYGIAISQTATTTSSTTTTGSTN